MSAAEIYGEYGPRQEYNAPGLTRTEGAFAVIAGLVEGKPAICLGQRDSQGAQQYRHIWELPGGKVPDNGRGARDALQRRLKEEIGIRRSRVGPAIGPPLHLAAPTDGQLKSVDAARAYVVVVTRGAPRPNPNGAAIQVAFANFHSLAGFNMLGLDRATQSFRRMAILVHDGLSVLAEPFYVGPLTNELRQMTIGNPEGSDYVLLAGGAYLALPFFVANEVDLVPGTKLGWNIKILARLNPFQPGGCFAGPLDHLKK